MSKVNRKKKIAIISRESDSKTLDISMLEAELLRRGCDVTVLSRLLTKEKSLKALGYIGHVLKQEAAILASDVVVLDTYCIPASMIPHRRGTRIVQMWHALGAVKKFGWQTVGKEGGSSEKTARLMRMHRGYDYVVSPSDITAGHYCEAFDTDPGSIVKYGLPRIDYIKSVAAGKRHEDTKKRIYARYPELRKDTPAAHGAAQGGSRLTVLYAPTFRPGKTVDVQSLIDALDPGRYELVVKLHPLYRGADSGDDGAAVRKDMSRAVSGEQLKVIYDEAFSSYDWLSAADIIISDYSSLVIEATLADKPLFIYAYDLDDYEESTGLNMDFYSEPIAPYVFRDAAGLADCLDEVFGDAGEAGSGAARSACAYDFGLLRAFRERYIDIDTGGPDDRSDNCTARLADFIINL